MENDELIPLLAARVVARKPSSSPETWEFIADEYEQVTGEVMARNDPYHIAIAAAVFGTSQVRQLGHDVRTGFSDSTL